MLERKERAFLNDILEAISRITSYTVHIEYTEFLHDLKTQDAVVRNIEIIGEATKQLSDEVRQKAPNIPWKSLAGGRVHSLGRDDGRW